MKRLILSAVLLVASSSVATGQTIIHVDASAAGSGDGSSWQNAFTSLQDGLAVASSGDQIRVASGIYTAHVDDRSASFELVDGVRLHGGFSGTESSLADRDLLANPTILSGDLAANDDGFSMRAENSFHVVRAVGVGANTLLEGFVIQAGHADGVDADSLGGGLLITGGSPVVMNTEFVGNYGRCGGGMTAIDDASPELVGIVVNGNRSLRGGGICSIDSTPSIINATITANTAQFGAGLFNQNASPSIANSIIVANNHFSDILECELLQYPCTIAEVPLEIRDSTLDMLNEAYQVRAAGSMDDVETFLESQSEIVDVARDSDVVSFRLRGGTPAVLMEIVTHDGEAHQRPSGTFELVEAAVRSPRLSKDVVGEDSNGDGVVDNLDIKKALILAPYAWDFGVFDESVIVDAIFQSIPEYQGNVIFKHNPDSLDQNIQLEDYFSWDGYDVIYVSSHGARRCYENDNFQASRCSVFLDSGVRITPEEDTIAIPGVLFGAIYEPLVSNSQVIAEEFLLSGDFFRAAYETGLDNALVVLSACETGGDFAGNFADDLGGENFVMLGWSESVDTDDANYASRRLLEEMFRGLSVEEALDVIESEGLRSTLNSDLQLTEFTRYAPDGGDQRIVELPTLMEDGEVIGNGTHVSNRVVGVIGDSEPDRIVLDLRLKGVVPEKKNQFSVRYAFNGVEAVGTYDLSQAVEIPPYAYSVQHDVDIGFPLETGSLKIEAIVDLPEGGESRFQVDTEVGGCFWTLELGGTRAGTYQGTVASFRRPNNTLFLQFGGQAETEPDDPPMFVSTVVAVELDVGSTPTFMLTASGLSAEAHGGIRFDVGILPNEYGSGDGVTDFRDINGNVVFTQPPPSLLVITENSDEYVAGTIEGTYWGPTDISAPAFEEADVSVSFRAEPATLSDGSPNPALCFTPDPDDG